MSHNLESYKWDGKQNKWYVSRAVSIRIFPHSSKQVQFILFKCSLYDELRREWVSHIVNKTANFLELDKINKFKVIFDTHHRITAKFILRCYQLRKESLYRI